METMGGDIGMRQRFPAHGVRPVAGSDKAARERGLPDCLTGRHAVPGGLRLPRERAKPVSPCARR
jgi:hypothetical protein